MKYCKSCNEVLIGGRKDRVFCGRECAANYQKVAWRKMNPKTSTMQLLNSTVAEMNELRVTLDLIGRGYEVYRAAVAGMPCDMVFKIASSREPTECVRVEVTSGNLTPSGTLQHPRRDESQYDILAVVVGEQIHYKPELL